jgi:hypothetical protein
LAAATYAIAGPKARAWLSPISATVPRALAGSTPKLHVVIAPVVCSSWQYPAGMSGASDGVGTTTSSKAGL